MYRYLIVLWQVLKMHQLVFLIRKIFLILFLKIIFLYLHVNAFVLHFISNLKKPTQKPKDPLTILELKRLRFPSLSHDAKYSSLLPQESSYVVTY